ncbi:hypothetical protein BT63DRAFT_428974 [Microthyrium microscopicum]|uniref:DUF3074 domain-containing protein n=1 Tax=Microthyrium microscopicum TaxID=703497 RepID=A0A6A6U1M5_9PEZI|nr:hypothetical protein BT63DRAFT_428974 [Microthyrium microscopicum]
MANLHAALESLGPRPFGDVPLDDLSNFISETFAQAELIVNSVPPPPPNPTAEALSSSSSGSSIATKAAEITPSAIQPHPVHPEHEDLRSSWGKPLKLNAKDNPLGLTLYKMAAHDRHGAWFARRSVHEGLPFDRWKMAMQGEFAESLAVSGGPGAGAIRGIGADRVLEKKLIKGLGKMEVYHFSAQFPGPTAPRDFVTLLLTTDSGLSDKSSPHDGGEKIDDFMPKHYMVVSIPVEHPDAPVKSGIVRASYESVEIIREVPRSDARSKSTPDLLDAGASRGRARGSTIGFAESRGVSAKGERIDKHSDDEMSNPVEWIMITRSDPGGGIPRFMVERGTPGSIAGDAVKFLDWATSKTEFLVEDDEAPEPELLKKVDTLEAPKISRRISNSSTFEPSGVTDTGIIASLTNVAKDYIPEGIQNMLPGASNLPVNEEDDDDDDSTETSSVESFASAEQFTTAPDGQEAGPSGVPTYIRHARDLSTPSTASIASTEKKEATTRLERELTKLENRRRELDEKFNKSQQAQAEKANEQLSKDQKDVDKIRQRLEKDRQRQERKHAKEVRKLDDKRAAEQRKAEERSRKAAEGDAVTRLTRERDQHRRMAEVLRQENDIWRERVGELQKENTLLVSRVVRLQGGRELLREIREEINADTATSGNLRASSPASGKSGKSAGAKSVGS